MTAEDAYVRSVYSLFLGREPSSSDLSNAVQIVRFSGREALTQVLSTSPEWAGVVVDQLYTSALDRTPDAQGRSYWVSRLAAGERTKAISVSIYGSDEARQSAGSDVAYVEDLYTRILSRPPDEAGLHFWTTLLTEGTSPTAIVDGLWDSVEFRRIRVATTYRQVLGREPDSGGLAHWSEQLLSIDEVRLAAWLAASDEFYRRSQDTASPPDTGPEPIPDPELEPQTIPRSIDADLTIEFLLGVVVVADEQVVDYQRSDWRHWSDLDGNGCDTRCEVLEDELVASVPALLGNPGYISIYDGEVFPTSDTSSMDLDHVVALSEAARSGGQAWNPDKKEQFANDLGWYGSLVLVSASSNRSKSDRDPASWLPSAGATDAGVTCRYLHDWLSVKYRWDLAVDPAEQTAIVNVAASRGC